MLTNYLSLDFRTTTNEPQLTSYCIELSTPKCMQARPYEVTPCTPTANHPTPNRHFHKRTQSPCCSPHARHIPISPHLRGPFHQASSLLALHAPQPHPTAPYRSYLHARHHQAFTSAVARICMLPCITYSPTGYKRAMINPKKGLEKEVG